MITEPESQRCVNKMQLVEETVFTEEIRCDHSYDKRCHTSYITAFQSQQEEECEENFRKTCFIQYEQVDRGKGRRRVLEIAFFSVGFH